MHTKSLKLGNNWYSLFKQKFGLVLLFLTVNWVVKAASAGLIYGCDSTVLYCWKERFYVFIFENDFNLSILQWRFSEIVVWYAKHLYLLPVWVAKQCLLYLQHNSCFLQTEALCQFPSTCRSKSPDESTRIVSSALTVTRKRTVQAASR